MDHNQQCASYGCATAQARAWVYKHLRVKVGRPSARMIPVYTALSVGSQTPFGGRHEKGYAQGTDTHQPKIVSVSAPSFEERKKESK